MTANEDAQLTKASIRIGPSILTSDLLRLGDQIALAENAGVDFIHLDVMDGRFVPNITFGMPLARAVTAATSLPVEVHLMIVEPERYVGDFVDCGADAVTIQVEACIHLHRTLVHIGELGAVPGIAVNPGTPLTTIEEIVPFIGTLLLMTVNPGFGGQTFIPATLGKIEQARQVLDDRNPSCRLQVDGGVKVTNIRRIAEAGADSFVAGSSVFDGTDRIAENVTALRSAASGDEPPNLTNSPSP